MSKLQLVRKYEPVLLFSKDGQGREENFFSMSCTTGATWSSSTGSSTPITTGHIPRRGE